MTENKQEKAEETVKNPAETEQQTSAPEAVKIPKKAKTTASEQPSSAKATKKATAIDDIMATVKNMTVLELSELVKALEAEFGVTAAAPMAAATTAATEAKTPAAEEEKTEFSVMLKDIGANKISVIKAVRELTSLGLKESKDLVESAPKAVREGISKEEAATTKQRLETAGATADII